MRFFSLFLLLFSSVAAAKVPLETGEFIAVQHHFDGSATSHLDFDVVDVGNGQYWRAKTGTSTGFKSDGDAHGDFKGQAFLDLGGVDIYDDRIVYYQFRFSGFDWNDTASIDTFRIGLYYAADNSTPAASGILAHWPYLMTAAIEHQYNADDDVLTSDGLDPQHRTVSPANVDKSGEWEFLIISDKNTVNASDEQFMFFYKTPSDEQWIEVTAIDVNEEADFYDTIWAVPYLGIVHNGNMDFTIENVSVTYEMKQR